MIDMIHHETGCSADDISNILNALGDVVKDRFGDGNNNVEIKLFPGLKISSSFIPHEQFVSHLGISNIDSVLKLNAEFSKRFRKEIKNKHKLLYG